MGKLIYIYIYIYIGRQTDRQTDRDRETKREKKRSWQRKRKRFLSLMSYQVTCVDHLLEKPSLLKNNRGTI